MQSYRANEYNSAASAWCTSTKYPSTKLPYQNKSVPPCTFSSALSKKLGKKPSAGHTHVIPAPKFIKNS